MNVLTNLERSLADVLAKDAERRAQHRALEIAMERFRHLHPTWHESLFDDSFVRRVLEAEEGNADARTLAREWTRQFRYRDPRRRERDVRQLEPVADSFLALLAQAKEETDPRRGRGRPRTSAGGHAQPTPC